MIAQLRRNLEHRCKAAPGAFLLLGLSGGGDSVALLHLLRKLAETWPLRLAAAHLDHALRPESAADAEWVAELCRQWQVPLVRERVEVAALAAAGRRNLEEVAREARHGFLLEVANRLGCELVVLAHHAGDQAETLLQRLLRGSGTAGLAGMAWRREQLIRPLLDVLPEQLDRYRHQQQLAWREDTSNADLGLTRNRIRRQLLPQLQTYNPAVVGSLAGLAERLQLDEDYWRERASTEQARLVELTADGLQLPVAGLLQLHPALRSRVLRGALQQLRGDLRGIEAVHLAALDRLLASDRPQADLDIPRGWAGRRYERLWLRHAAPEAEPETELEIATLGRYRLPGGGHIDVSFARFDQVTSPYRVQYHPGQVGLPLRIRSVRPGDRFRPSGMGGHKKVKAYWGDNRLPREARQRLLVLEGQEILWLIGERRCDGYWPEVKGEPALQLVFTPANGPN